MLIQTANQKRFIRFGLGPKTFVVVGVMKTEMMSALHIMTLRPTHHVEIKLMVRLYSQLSWLWQFHNFICKLSSQCSWVGDFHLSSVGCCNCCGLFHI
jgi:hypothetical protein